MRLEPISASTSTLPLSIIGPTTVGPLPVTRLTTPGGKAPASAWARSALASTP